ncbi:MAG: FHA domain-containing protein [Gemmataceae bacterium]
MNVKLIASHNGRRTVLPLRTPIAVIGRAHGNAVRIPSADVSRRHCRLVFKDGFLTAEDLDSVNGTFLNGKRLSSAHPVYPGDRLDIGPVSFTAEYELSEKTRGKMQPQEDPVELLEALADGDIMDLEPVEEALPELEVPDARQRPGRGPADPDLELEPTSPAADPLAPLEADFDFDAAPWQMPDGGDLRGLLDGMEDEPSPPAKSKKRRP